MGDAQDEQSPYRQEAERFCKEYDLPVAQYVEIIALAMVRGAELVLKQIER